MIAPYIPFVVTNSTGSYVLEATFRQGAFSAGICIMIALASIGGWAIIFRKLWTLHRTARENEKFTDVFRQLGGDFGTILDRSERCPNSTMAQVFRDAYEELRQSARISNEQLVMSKEVLDLVSERSERSISQMVANLEKDLVFLATATSICPFLGLLGTVWGLLGAFGGMGASGNADIATVGTGVAEALVTTLVGLAAAIPCSLFYNHFQSMVGQLTTEMDRFASELRSRLARNMVYHRTRDTEKPPMLPKVSSRREDALVGTKGR